MEACAPKQGGGLGATLGCLRKSRAGRSEVMRWLSFSVPHSLAPDTDPHPIEEPAFPFLNPCALSPK